jgi:hypothetical protein
MKQDSRLAIAPSCKIEDRHVARHGYVVEQAEEALERAQAAAKADIEAYIDKSARRLGLEKISDLKQLTAKDDNGNS